MAQFQFNPGIMEVPTNRVMPNPYNPRPKYMLTDDDPKLQAMINSIEHKGQLLPGMVFEQVGHWELADKPGHYVLLQGERRWRSCVALKRDTYRAIVIQTPQSRSEEMALLCADDAHREPWLNTTYAGMRHVWEYAQSQNISVKSAEIMDELGMTPAVARDADKIFRLDERIHSLVGEYEQAMYESRERGDRAAHGRVRMLGEFTRAKAALIYDIYFEINKRFPETVRSIVDPDDFEYDLQRRIAQSVTHGGSSHDDLESLLGMIRGIRGEFDNLPLTQEVERLLRNPGASRAVRRAVRVSGGAELKRLTRSINHMASLNKTMRPLAARQGELVKQTGSDLTILLEAKAALMETVKNAEVILAALNHHLQAVKNMEDAA